MNYKILIVDDEQLERRALESSVATGYPGGNYAGGKW